MTQRTAVALMMIFGGCSSTPTPESEKPLTLFEGSADVLNHRMDVVFRSPSGAFQSAVTLPYGTSAGDVYFHTCPGTVSFNAATHILTASVQAVNLMSGTVGSLNAIIDSTSPSTVTPTGIMAMYGSVAPNSKDCLSSTSTWNFTDPTNANFTFRGHADGTPTASFVALADQVKAGNQAWLGQLGMMFDVVTPIVVTQMGCFDDNADGLQAPITVAIWNRTSQTVVGGTQVTLAPGTGVLVGGDRFQTLGAPVALPVGQYLVTGSGYGPAENNFNCGGAPTCNVPNTGGGKINFVGGGIYSNGPTGYPTTVDGGPANRYGSGTFIFQ